MRLSIKYDRFDYQTSGNLVFLTPVQTSACVKHQVLVNEISYPSRWNSKDRPLRAFIMFIHLFFIS